ncbi:hypothetical protein PG984_003664 [Apiospora sp. TS-2023a]
MASENTVGQVARKAPEFGLDLLMSGKFADAQVVCDGRTWEVHRVVVCTRSKWFDKALGGYFKEAAEKKVTLHEMPSAHVDWLLRYIYGGDDLLNHTDDLDKKPFVAFCVAHQLGDYFDITDLSTAATAAILDACNLAIRFYQAHGSRPQGLRPPRGPARLPFSSEVGMCESDFFEKFFAGVGKAYEMQYPAVKDLQDAFLEFVMRTRYTVLMSRIFIVRMQEHTVFAFWVMMSMSSEFRRGVMPLPQAFPSVCSKCKGHPLRNHGHFARVSEANDIKEGWKKGICSDCFQSERDG